MKQENEIKYIKRRCKFCKITFTIPKGSKHEYCSLFCEKKDIPTSYRGPSFEYVCRILTTKNKSGNAYGITIPRKLVEEHKLLGKKFKIEIDNKGVFSIRTQIKYEEIK